ncbi:TPA: hypothetical protein J4Z61_004376 [Escherichia coli]|nr:hypothetical protein [Escherichia coli]HBD2971317.1 hypothetical protein [Escherichia coli]
MDLIFKYKQATFLRAQQIDRNFHSGLCFIMCIDYIYNKKHNLPCDFLYFCKTWQFTSRHRALLYLYQSGKYSGDPYLMKNGKLTLKYLRKADHPIEIYLLTQGCYIINISLDQGTKAHAVAYIKKIGETLFFDPNHGEYNIKNKLNLLDFLKREYSTRVDYISIYQVTEPVYHSV